LICHITYTIHEYSSSLPGDIRAHWTRRYLRILHTVASLNSSTLRFVFFCLVCVQIYFCRGVCWRFLVLKHTHWHSHVVADRHHAMKIVDWGGWEAIIELIDNGVALAEIVDRWGRSVHPVADGFLSCHVQVKRMILRAYDDASGEKRLLLRRVLKTRTLNSNYQLARQATVMLAKASARAKARK